MCISYFPIFLSFATIFSNDVRCNFIFVTSVVCFFGFSHRSFHICSCEIRKHRNVSLFSLAYAIILTYKYRFHSFSCEIRDVIYPYNYRQSVFIIPYVKIRNVIIYSLYSLLRYFLRRISAFPLANTVSIAFHE